MAKILLVCLMMAGFGVAAAEQTPTTASCRLFEAAFVATTAAGLAAVSDIVVGCPGYEMMETSLSTWAGAHIYRTAMAADVPILVREEGPVAESLFRQMIARGVPVPVAKDMSNSIAFRAAVRASSP